MGGARSIRFLCLLTENLNLDCQRLTFIEILMCSLKLVGITLYFTIKFIWKNSTKIYTNHEEGKGGATIPLVEK